MTLSTRHRATIYQKLAPILGDEEADALLAEFPAAEHDRLVTEGVLRAETNQIRVELHQEIGTLRAEMHQLANRNLAIMCSLVVTAIGVTAAIS